MKSVQKSRAIIAAMVHNGTGMADITHLKSCAVTIFNAAGGDLELLSQGKSEITATVEGPQKSPTVDTDFGLTIGWCQQSELELAIAAIENAGKPKKSSRNNGPDKPELMLALGSREFCMAFAHLWATSLGKQGASEWGLHMIRKLATSEPTMVVWYDSEDDKLTFGNGADMYKDMKAFVTAAH